MQPHDQKDELKGTTLRVYRYILKAGKPVRVGDLQRKVGMSSASLAQYHVRKLLDMGLIREEQKGYVVEKVLADHVFRIRSTLMPFQAAYVIFFSITLIGLIISRPPIVTSFAFFAISANIAALAISIYEMRRTLRNIP